MNIRHIKKIQKRRDVAFFILGIAVGAAILGLVVAAVTKPNSLEDYCPKGVVIQEGTHVVQDGETLTSITNDLIDRYKMEVDFWTYIDDIYSHNPEINNPNQIRRGQIIGYRFYDGTQSTD